MTKYQTQQQIIITKKKIDSLNYHHCDKMKYLPEFNTLFVTSHESSTSDFFSRSLVFSVSYPQHTHRWQWLRLCTFYVSTYLYLIANINQCVYIVYYPCQCCSVEPRFHLCCFHICTQTHKHAYTLSNTQTHILHQIANKFNSTCSAIIKLSIGGASFCSYFTFSYSLHAIVLALTHPPPPPHKPSIFCISVRYFFLLLLFLIHFIGGFDLVGFYFICVFFLSYHSLQILHFTMN